MQPALVYCPHPLLASADRELRYETFEAGESAGAYLRRLGYDLRSGTWYLTLNGHLVHPDDWERVYPQAGDLITVRARVAGSDEEGGKNPVATILTIALVIVSYGGAGAALGTALGVSSQLGTALLITGGTLLINALLPPLKPNLANALKGNADTGAGTYSLTGGSNRARPYEPLTRVLGRQRVYPDLGSRPYTEFRGEDQYLFQVFHFGISDGTALLRLRDFRIGDTPATDFQDVTIEESGPDGRLSLFPANVDTVNGGTLTAAAGWITRTSAADATGLHIEISGLLFSTEPTPRGVASIANPETKLAVVQLAGNYRKVGAPDWRPLFDGENIEYAIAYWSWGTYAAGVWQQYGWDYSDATLHVDGAAETVYTTVNTDEVESLTGFWRWRAYAEINGGVAGGPLSEPAPPQLNQRPATEIQLTSASRRPLRRTVFLRVPKGQYEVRIMRLTPDSNSTHLVSEIVWAQLRSYQPDEADYTGQKRVAVMIKASGQLQGTLEQFNAFAESLIAVHDGTRFVTVETNNPAWLMYAALRGGTLGGRRTWGCGLPLDRIDKVSLQAFSIWCASKGLEFNAVFDQRMNCLDMLNAIALTGRGSLSMANGKYGVVWDAPNQPVMQVFGLGNIKADTFAVRWVSEKLGDEIALNFWNREKSAQDTVRALVPGVTAPANPVQVERFGVDNLDQARREANLIAAAQKYRRRFVSFEADYEGQVIARGDVVALSHDLFAATELTSWGYSGRLLAGTTTLLTLDRPIVMSATQTNYCAVRFPDGGMHVRAVVYAPGEVSAILLATGLPAHPNDDTLNPVIDYIWLFGLDATGAAKRFKVQDVQPLGDKDVHITLVDENPLYYAAEFAPVTEPVPQPVQARLPSITGVTFSEELIRVGAGFGVTLSIRWDVSGVYDHANLRVSVDGLLVADTAVSGRVLELNVPGAGLVSVVILPVHPLFGAGVPATFSHSLTAQSDPPPNVDWLAVEGDVISWGAVTYVALAGYQLRFHYEVNTDWGSATPLHAGVVTNSPLRMPVNLAGAVTILIKAISGFGTESSAPAVAVTSFAGPGVAGIVESMDLRNVGWPGDLVGGARVSGDAVANDATLAMWNPNDTVGMWRFDSSLMWHAAVWHEMTYLATVTPTQAGTGSMMTLAHNIEGSSYAIEYRRTGANPMWGLSTEPMWSPDPAERMWGEQQADGLMPRSMWRGDGFPMWGADANVRMWHTQDGGFSTWPGQLPVQNGDYEIRVTTGFGGVRGKLVDMVFTIDAPSASESFNNVGIAAGGTRLPLVKNYRQINSVSGAAFTDGGAAIGFTVEDYEPVLGPLIKTRNATGTPVAGTFTGFIEGYLS